MFFLRNIKNIENRRKITFEIIANEWLEMKRKEVKITTYSNYFYSVNNYFKKRFKNYTLKELEKYCIENKDLKCLGIIIVMNTGLRIGEICALKWKNIDLDKREIRVRQTAERIYDDFERKTKVILIKPKSQNSIRNIPMSNKLYSILVKTKNSNPESFFLTGQKEKIIEPRTYLNDFKKILKNSKIKKNYKFHALRHTFATNCIDVGMDAKSLSEILGHSNIKITLEKYVHSSYKIKKKYLEKI